MDTGARLVDAKGFEKCAAEQERGSEAVDRVKVENPNSHCGNASTHGVKEGDSRGGISTSQTQAGPCPLPDTHIVVLSNP